MPSLLAIGAWIVFAVWSLSMLGAARSRLTDALAHMPLSHTRGLLRGWAMSLKLCQLLTVVLVLLAVWAAVLLLRRRPSPRQWATILVAVSIITIGWFLFAGFGAPLAEARAWFSPGRAYAAQLGVAAGAFILFVLAVIAVRRTPEPVDPQQDRYAIASYTQFNKPGPAKGSAALTEARARAESVLPVDEESDAQ